MPRTGGSRETNEYFGNVDQGKSHLDRLPFLDGDTGIQRYDVVAQPSIERWNDKGLGNFWRPEED